MLPPAAPDPARWLDAVARRRSRREYDGVPVTEADLAEIERLCAEFRPYPEARAVLVREAPADLFVGVVGAYGRVSGAPSALAFVAGAGPHARERCGYTGEGLVLEATARGLATCWIGGAFSRSKVGPLVVLEPGESVVCVSPLGHAVARPPARERLVFGAGRPKRRRSLDEIAPGSGAWPGWALAGLEAARVAPSAMHRQPWRFAFEDGAVRLSAAGMPTPLIGLRLDCGIAMLHFELAARVAGCDGVWEPMEGADVARWVPAT